MNNMIKPIITTSLLLLALSGCSESTKAPIEDFPASFTQKPETERLRYFKEIGMTGVRQSTGLTGKGVRITIMGEATDASHPDLQKRVHKQYNTFAQKGKLLSGTGNQPYAFEVLKEGHGTHIAGTIAAECDSIALQGVACGATLDVFDIGTYDNVNEIPLKGWEKNTHDMSRLLQAYSHALNVISQQGTSKIVTGSFNQESPLVQYQPGSTLAGKSLSEIIAKTEGIEDINALVNTGLVTLTEPQDQQYLERLTEKYEDPVIALGTLLPLSSEWAEMERQWKNIKKPAECILLPKVTMYWNVPRYSMHCPASATG